MQIFRLIGSILIDLAAATIGSQPWLAIGHLAFAALCLTALTVFIILPFAYFRLNRVLSVK